MRFIDWEMVFVGFLAVVGLVRFVWATIDDIRNPGKYQWFD